MWQTVAHEGLHGDRFSTPNRFELDQAEKAAAFGPGYIGPVGYGKGGIVGDADASTVDAPAGPNVKYGQAPGSVDYADGYAE